MIKNLAHAGVEHATELQSTAHNNASTLILISGIALSLGIIIYWMLTRSSATSNEEEDNE